MIDTYIFKSACWLTGFAIIYIIFLRNERFFVLKRIYLLAGLVLSCILPLVTVHYTVAREAESQVLITAADYLAAGSYTLPAEDSQSLSLTVILQIIYIAGIAVLFARLLWHIFSIWHEIRKNQEKRVSSKIVRVDKFSFSFSFFSYVLINPSVQGNDLNEIINHELVHVRQKHWIDLVIAELIRIVQWMNPFAWIYLSLIRKNHEYLADAGALMHSPDPSNYKAALLNQMFRAPVFSTSNSFSYSLNKTRFEMMKMIATSPYRKLKTFLIIPVSAVILYAFSEPVYVQTASPEIPGGTIITEQVDDPAFQQQIQSVSGTILTDEGKSLAGASIAVTGSQLRVRADDNGKFKVERLPANSYLLFSAKGYITQVLKPVYGTEMTIKLDKDPKYVPDPVMPNASYPSYIPPQISSDAMVVIDGVISDRNSLRSIPSSEIINTNILRGETAVNKYGEKARNGALEVITRKASGSNISSGEVPFTVVENMPMFPGGDRALLEFVAKNTRYPDNARKRGIEGRVIVRFVVNAQGKVENAVVLRGVDPDLDNEAIRVVSLLDNFTPGTQGGRPVPVYYMVPITFTLNNNAPPQVPGPGEVINRNASGNVSSSGEVPFVVVESMPMFPGGDQELLKTIAMNTRYPEKARMNGIEGRVIVRFVVNAQGKVENAVVMKGVDPELDNEAVRVVSLLDNFVPGTQGGRPVPVYYMVPITFSLPFMSEASRSTLLKYVASNIIYPDAARANSITGQVLVGIKTEKGGVIKEAAVADPGSKLPRLPEVVVVAYREQQVGTGQGGINLLETEALRVANSIGATGIPELGQKDMEFIIPVTFVLKDK